MGRMLEIAPPLRRQTRRDYLVRLVDDVESFHE